MEMFNLVAKLKSLKLESGEDLIVYLSQSLDVFKSFKAEVELQIGKKIKAVRSNRGGEYYESLWGEALKITVHILNRVPTKVVNKTSYELWTGKKPSINHFHIWGCPAEARPYRPHERKLDSRIVSCYFVGYAECSWGYKFYGPTSRSFFEKGNVRILKEVKFGKEENIRKVVFEEESVNDVGHILVPITVQETIPVIRDNVQTTVLDIVSEQDYDEALPQTPIEQPQQPQQVSLRISIREKRYAIPDDYIVFL
ncbi:hypothetical protein CR513_16055, partial [Mucuna pruriens]